MDDMEQIGWLIETEPMYNALVHEMYPIDKIEAEVALIVSRAEEQRKKDNDNSNTKAVLTGEFVQGWKQKKKN